MTRDITREDLEILGRAQRELTIEQCALIAERAAGENPSFAGRVACRSVARAIRESREKGSPW